MKKALLILTLFFSCTNTIELTQAQKIWCKQTYNESLPIALVGESILRDEIQGDKQKVYELALDDIKIISSLEYVLEEIYQDEVDIFSGNEQYILPFAWLNKSSNFESKAGLHIKPGFFG